MSVQISTDQLKILADLVKLNPVQGLAGPQAATRLQELSDLCSGFMDSLQSLTTTDVENNPPVYLPLSILEQTLALRPDKAQQPHTRAELLATSPESDEQFFVVPNML